MEIIKEKNRVFIEQNNETIAYVTFPKVNDTTVNIDHTVVHPSLRGQGIASLLLEKAYESIKEQGLKANLSCSYAIKWFDKHIDKKDILL